MAQQQIDFDPSTDYYKALGLTDKATPDEIKKAYRKLAKANHPDSTGGDKAKEQRFKSISVAYEVLGDAKKKQLYDQIRAGGPDPRNPFSNMGGGGGQQYYTTSRGGGPGVFDLGDLFGQFFNQQAQQGRGGRRPEPVSDVEPEIEQVKASDGTWLEVEGADVRSDVRISFDRAILGTIATVATRDGKVDLKIPPGTSSGKKLRLKGKGLPGRGGQSGDHYVTVQIDVPKDLDEEAQKQLVSLVTRLRKRGHSE